MLYLWTKYRGAVVALILYDGTNSVEGKAVFSHVGTSETVTKNGKEFEAAVECFMASTEATFECFQVVVFDQFKDRFADHRKQVASLKSQSLKEIEAFRRHQQLHPPKTHDEFGNPRYCMHAAKDLL